MFCRRNQDGFLYVELLVGLVILSFALLAIAPMFALAARSNAASGDETYASVLATDMAEELRAVHYEALTPGTFNDEPVMGSVRYRRTWTVEQDRPYPRMKQVTVVVEPVRSVRIGRARVARVRYFRVP